MLKRLKQLFRRSESSPSSQLRPPANAQQAVLVRRGPAVVHHPIPLTEIDPDAVKIVRRLTRFGHTAYLVGGCVRDLLLERKPKDFDVGTTATPRQVRRLFRNCRIIGRRFRLAHVYFRDGKIIEVATFRARDPEEFEDSTAPNGDMLFVRDDNVFGTPEEDALRRDFTINALFYDLNQETVIDHADGLGDLRRRLIRTIGDPERRFREDPIRALRAIKFAARLGFEIEPQTLRALEATRNLIPRAAAPRILEEINRFCRAGAAVRSFELLRRTGVFQVILPEFAEGYEQDPGAWRMLLALLAALDRQHREGREVRTAEILAALVLPLILPRMGWRAEGTSREAKGARVRELADAYLKPFAHRLRCPKRELEHCRQILATLRRLAPAERLSRAARVALAHRASAPAALALFERVAQELGGPYAEAAARWRELAPTAALGPPGPPTRSGRRTRKARAPGLEQKASSTEPSMPPPWDDEYFFAALPRVPSLPQETSASEPVRAPEANAPPNPEAAAAPATGTRRRRRHRRRRRRGSRALASPEPPAEP